MKGGRKRCAECGRTQKPLPPGEAVADGLCAACGAPLDGSALSEFASRLARFGLGATPAPLLSRLPELPNAE
jgi:hypothetical protein